MIIISFLGYLFLSSFFLCFFFLSCLNCLFVFVSFFLSLFLSSNLWVVSFIFPYLYCWFIFLLSCWLMRTMPKNSFIIPIKRMIRCIDRLQCFFCFVYFFVSFFLSFFLSFFPFKRMIRYIDRLQFAIQWK